MQRVYHRATTLFTELHGASDQLLVVTDVHCSLDRKNLIKFHINYPLLIKALCNQDAGIKPQIGKRIFSTDLYYDRQAIERVFQ